MAIDLPPEDSPIGARIVAPEFLPSALTAAHSRLTTGPASTDAIRRSITPVGSTTRRHVAHTIQLATDLGLFTSQGGGLLALNPEVADLNAFRIACLRTLVTPPAGEGLGSSEHGTQRSAVFMLWLARQDPDVSLTTQDIQDGLAHQVPSMQVVTNVTQVNTLKRWAIWCGIAEPSGEDSSIRPLPARAVLACLRTKAFPRGESIPAGDFAESLCGQLPWLPEGQLGIAMTDLLGQPHLAPQTFSRGCSRALLAIQRHGAITLTSADDADERTTPWSLDITGNLRQTVARVEVSAA